LSILLGLSANRSLIYFRNYNQQNQLKSPVIYVTHNGRQGIIVFNSMEACIIHIESKHYAYIAIEGYLQTSKIKEFASKYATLCQKRMVHYTIFDASKITDIKHNDLIWIVGNILPIINNSSIKRIAFLIPENPFGEIALNSFFKKINSPNVEVFENMELAENWVLGNDVKINSMH
jgi:hypothetical protein